MLFACSDPRAGLMPIRQRKEEENNINLKPLFPDYYDVGKKLAKEDRLGVDMFIFSKDSLMNHELATTHCLSSLTGGSLNYYPSYLHEKYFFL